MGKKNEKNRYRVREVPREEIKMIRWETKTEEKASQVEALTRGSYAKNTCWRGGAKHVLALTVCNLYFI